LTLADHLEKNGQDHCGVGAAMAHAHKSDDDERSARGYSGFCVAAGCDGGCAPRGESRERCRAGGGAGDALG